jgi:hypothetical protein
VQVVFLRSQVVLSLIIIAMGMVISEGFYPNISGEKILGLYLGSCHLLWKRLLGNRYVLLLLSSRNLFENHSQTVTKQCAKILIFWTDLATRNCSEHRDGTQSPVHPTIPKFIDDLESIGQSLHILNTLLRTSFMFILKYFSDFFAFNVQMHSLILQYLPLFLKSLNLGLEFGNRFK